ncbi:hypothetical protein E2C01_096833 [Portunus trituberculatus]|uniref:Uncharacterized protein n=1 Tax=Portunus trituberculatus TaxID=210409 RepID=A0A5B7JYV5_PORTR|nr:hypothetical protein [Portunus trituberculatus]
MEMVALAGGGDAFWCRTCQRGVVVVVVVVGWQRSCEL